MGKAKGYYTPEQLVAIQKMVVRWPYTPEQLATMQKVVAKHSPEELAKLDKMLDRIDRVGAIRDGLIPPPWAEQLPKPASEAEPEPEPEPTRKERKSYWDDPVDRALSENFPDNSATNFRAGVVVKKVLKVLDPEIKTSGEEPPSRGLILRKSGHWKTKTKT